MSDVWDRASEAIAGRARILIAVVLLFIWLPGLVRGAARLALVGPAVPATTAPGIGAQAVLVVLGLVVVALGALGHLQLVAVTSDPAVSRRDALRIAMARFWPYIGIMLPVVVAAGLLFAPIAVATIAAYPGMAAMRAGAPPQMSPGAGLFVGLYGLVLVAVFLWVEARVLSVLVPVIVNERLGLGSYRRAWELTRGLAWRIVGVIVLFGVVALVAVLAVRSVVGVALRLTLGEGAAAPFLAAVAVSLLGCAITVVVAAFCAQLYVATRGVEVR